MTQQFQELIASQMGGVFRCHRAIPEAALALAAQRGMAVVPVRLAAARDKKAFLNTVAEALRFPDYFGHNWDAFYDCLIELKPGDGGTLIVLREASGFARAEPDEFAAAVAALQDACEYWNEKGKVLTVIAELQLPALAPELLEVIPPTV